MKLGSWVAVVLFALYTACSSVGLLLFKRGWPQYARALADGNWWSLPAVLPALGAAFYAASFLMWLVIVTRVPLTIAYPVAIGLSLVAITIGAVLWLGEPLSTAHLVGAGLIVAGIALIAR